MENKKPAYINAVERLDELSKYINNLIEDYKTALSDIQQGINLDE